MNRRLGGALEFIRHEAASGVILLAAALVALLMANSPLSGLYNELLEMPVAIGIDPLQLDKHLLHWINDGLMAIFFVLVGLEIKREMLAGELSTRTQATLPVVGAIGGMIVPALIYMGFNWSDPVAAHGWAIPTATDIAFAVGVMALLGDRVPNSLKVFLLALAIIDDLGAIVMIALFYTAQLSLAALALAALGIVALGMLNRGGVLRLWPYLLVGFFIWLCVLKSGVHATLAGVVTALAVPMTVPRGAQYSPLARAEEGLHPWVTYGVLPLFAFANAGVSLAGITPGKLVGSIPAGIALGLFIGKPVGIFLFSRLAIAAGLGEKPDGATWAQLFGAAILGGIGFTMSLFIGTLAFTDAVQAAEIRIGVLAGSLASAVTGFQVLRWLARISDRRIAR